MPATTTNDLEAARKILSGDWDEDGTKTITLPASAAEKLLEQRGWSHEIRAHSGSRTYGTDRHTYSVWYSPDGHGPYWSAGDALQTALLAETI